MTGFTVALAAWAALLGVLSWGPVGHPAMSLLVLAVWGLARRRSDVLVASMAYFLGSQDDLLSMPGRFYDLNGAANTLAGLGAWIAWSALGAVVIASCWMRRFPAPSLIIGLVAITIPPVGWFMMANPLHAAGWWFPGSGVAGVLAALGAAFVLAWLPNAWHRPKRVVVGACVVIIAGVVATHAVYRAPEPPAGLQALDTHFGRFPVGSEKSWHRAESINELVEQFMAQSERPSVLLLPEMVIGMWTPKAEYWLYPTIQATADSDLVIVLGAADPPIADGSRKPRNGIVLIQGGKATWLPGRIPMPGGDWHFGKSSFEASPWVSPVVQLGPLRAGVVICYENALAWVHLQAMVQHTDVHASIASLWWAKDLPIDRRMRLMAEGWARLAGVPLVMAVNW